MTDRKKMFASWHSLWVRQYPLLAARTIAQVFVHRYLSVHLSSEWTRPEDRARAERPFVQGRPLTATISWGPSWRHPGIAEICILYKSWTYAASAVATRPTI